MVTTCPDVIPLNSGSRKGVLISFSCMLSNCNASKRTMFAVMDGVASKLEMENFAAISRWEKDAIPFDDTVHQFSSMLGAVAAAWRQRDLVRSLLQKRYAVLIKNYGKCPFYHARRSGHRQRDELGLQTVLRQGLPSPDLEVVVSQDGLIISARTDKHCVLRIKDRCFGIRRGSFSVLYFDGALHTIEVIRTQSVSQMVRKVARLFDFFLTAEHRDVSLATRKSPLSSSCPDLSKEDIILCTPLRQRSPSPTSGDSDQEIEVQLE